MSLLQRLGACLAAAVCLSGTASAQSASPGPSTGAAAFPVIDSGFPADDRSKAFWLDNERVIFRGFDVSKGRVEEPGLVWPETTRRSLDSGFTFGYYIWDTQKNTIRLYKSGVTSLCVENGLISYVTPHKDSESKPIAWRGPLGKEKPLKEEPGDVIARHHPGYEGSCLMSWPRPDLPRSRFGRVLRPEFGVLLRGETSRSPVLYYRTNAKTGIELPIETQPFTGGRVRFAPWQGRYLVQEDLALAPNPQKRLPRAFFLARDGRVEMVYPPSLPLWPDSVRYTPTRVGVV